MGINAQYSRVSLIRSGSDAQVIEKSAHEFFFQRAIVLRPESFVQRWILWQNHQFEESTDHRHQTQGDCHLGLWVVDFSAMHDEEIDDSPESAHLDDRDLLPELRVGAALDKLPHRP